MKVVDEENTNKPFDGKVVVFGTSRECEINKSGIS